MQDHEIRMLLHELVDLVILRDCSEMIARSVAR
jgi:hypothetical protein